MTNYSKLFWSTKPSSCDGAYSLIPTALEVSYNPIRVAHKRCVIEGQAANWTPPVYVGMNRKNNNMKLQTSYTNLTFVRDVSPGGHGKPFDPS